jgi:hypothetical protein
LAYDWILQTEIVFIVEEDPDGGLTAHAVGASIITQGDTPEQLRSNVRDAVRCHFPDEPSRPRVIRLHHVRDELLVHEASPRHQRP